MIKYFSVVPFLGKLLYPRDTTNPRYTTLSSKYFDFSWDKRIPEVHNRLRISSTSFDVIVVKKYGFWDNKHNISPPPPSLTYAVLGQLA